MRETARDFMRDEAGMGTVEIILIIVVLIGLVIIFKKQLNDIVKEGVPEDQQRQQFDHLHGLMRKVLVSAWREETMWAMSDLPPPGKRAGESVGTLRSTLC